MQMRNLWLGSVALLLLLGCGARSLSGDSSSSGDSDGTAGDDGPAPPHTSGTDATSSTAPTSTTSSLTTSTGATSSAGSTTEISTEPIPGTWEGITFNTGWGTYMTVCGFGEVCFPASCENLYVRAVGTMRWVYQGIDGCNGWSLDIEEVLEARACEPTDCGADCSGPISCESECDAAGQDCPAADKCVARASEGPLDTHPRQCQPLPAAPLGQGEACAVAAATEDRYDECDGGLHCWAEDPTATIGVCVPFCHVEFPDTCPDDCVPCSFGYGHEGLCLPDCPDCDLFHSC